jgi:hypothetical protein
MFGAINVHYDAELQEYRILYVDVREVSATPSDDADGYDETTVKQHDSSYIGQTFEIRYFFDCVVLMKPTLNH